MIFDRETSRLNHEYDSTSRPVVLLVLHGVPAASIGFEPICFDEVSVFATQW